MNTESNTTNGGFSKAYDMLPAGEQARVRQKIMRTCDWKSKVTFYAKKDAKAPLRKLERAALEGIFAAWNIDAWTGEYIKQVV